MKKKELGALKTKSVSELAKMAADKREEITKTKIDMLSGKETNNRKARTLRHELAQILTIQTIISKSEKSKETKSTETK